MKLQDALFNWLQIKIVSEAREGDNAALETLQFFEQILHEDQKLTQFCVEQVDDTMYHVQYELDGKSKKQMFDKESAEKLLHDINLNPKYN